MAAAAVFTALAARAQTHATITVQANQPGARLTNNTPVGPIRIPGVLTSEFFRLVR